VAKIMETLAVNKLRSQRFHMVSFNLKKLNEVENNSKFCVEISNRFAALKDLDTEMEINSAWETIVENIKTSVKESLGNLDEGCSQLLDQKKLNCSGYRIKVKLMGII
jgi:hypothetical protein